MPPRVLKAFRSRVTSAAASLALLLAPRASFPLHAGNPVAPEASPHPPGSVPPAPSSPSPASSLWSLQPVSNPPLPPVARDGSAHPVDRFLDARMAAAGIAPAHAAPPDVLLRRLAFVLTGLPPTPEETLAFAADKNPDALERATDRLLASPQFGERWARHWMDVVRYCESHGSQGDPELPMAWRYRDYLVRAFNTDVPYDQFVREHVAGDLLPSPRINPVAALNESALGTAHLRMVELGYIPVDALDDQVKVVDNQVDVLSKAFLALTVSCARCHDHKFDPISQNDFHAWYGILASGKPGQVVVDAPGLDSAALESLAAAKQRIRAGLGSAWADAARRIASDWPRLAALEREVEAAEAEWKATSHARSDIESVARKSVLASAHPSHRNLPAPIARWTFESGADDDLGPMHGKAESGASIQNGRLRIPGGDAHVVTAPLPSDLKAMTLEAWVALDDLAQQGGGVLTVQTPDSAIFDSIVFGERERGHWIAGSDFFKRTQDVGGPAETRGPGELVHLAIAHADDGTITLFRDGLPYGKPYQPGPAHAYRKGIDRVVLGRRHLTAGVKAISGEVEEARLYDRALSADEVMASFKAGYVRVPMDALLAAMSGADRARHAELVAKENQLTQRLASLRKDSSNNPAWTRGLADAAKDSFHPLHPWALLRNEPPARFKDAWAQLVADTRGQHASRLAFNQSHFTPAWNLRETHAPPWFNGPPHQPARPSPPGDFIVEPVGDKVVTRILPGGVLSPVLTQKKPGVLVSPRFVIRTTNISIRALGSHANARVVIENYPIGNGGIYPARGLDRDAPAWFRFDTAYRIGSHAHIEVVTAEDFPTGGFRSGPRPYQDGRAGFAVSEVVFHDGPESPKETLWPWRALASGSPPDSPGALARLLADHAVACVQRWRQHASDDEDVAFIHALLLSGALPSDLASLPSLAADVAQFRKAEASIPVPTRAPGLHEVAGEDFPLFQRGDPNRPGPVVPRGFLAALGGKPYPPAGSGRLPLARDLSHPSNPLVARVMVNRIWHHVFGRGLVPTPDNFGRLGVPPTHPELLDALAARFIREGWSVRAMVRFLVTSAAFARSPIPPRGAAETDPANDLLSHARVRRLDAEALRDSLLAVSGQLDRRMGGPGVNVYYTSKTEGGGPQGPLDGERRRSVYQRIRRNAHNPFLEAFDAPKPTSTRGARDVTNVPAQSLAMLNDPFVREMAARWAARLVAEGRPREARIRDMLATALGRPAMDAEVASFSRHLSDLCHDHGVPESQSLGAAPVWADLAQSIFCLKEFLYVR